MGTLPYMAPEQVEGKPADARTDLWALGLILYEMLTGHRAFEASTPTSLVGAILEREPAPLCRPVARSRLVTSSSGMVKLFIYSHLSPFSPFSLVGASGVPLGQGVD